MKLQESACTRLPQAAWSAAWLPTWLQVGGGSGADEAPGQGLHQIVPPRAVVPHHAVEERAAQVMQADEPAGRRRED